MSDQPTESTPPVPLAGAQLVVFWGSSKNKQTLRSTGIESRKDAVMKNASAMLQLPDGAQADVPGILKAAVTVEANGEYIHTTLELVWLDIVAFLSGSSNIAGMVDNAAIQVLMPGANNAADGVANKITRRKATDGREVGCLVSMFMQIWLGRRLTCPMLHTYVYCLVVFFCFWCQPTNAAIALTATSSCHYSI